MEIITYEAQPKSNPYTDDVAQFIAAIDAENTTAETEKRPALAVSAVYVWPTEHFNKERNLFAKAANDADRTAKIHMREDTVDDDGNKNTKVSFNLTRKHARRRNKEAEDAKKAAEAAAKEAGNDDDGTSTEGVPVDPQPPVNDDENGAVEETAAANVAKTPVARNRNRR
jgi:hypothetical protein